jgi:hypothetical protein
MKKLRNKEIKLKKISKPGEHHSFLFWLVFPILLVWLSVGYISGFIADKPLWFNADKIVQKENSVIPYYQEYGDLALDLNQPFVSLWFDDAWNSQYLEAYKVLKQEGLPGVIAVPTNAIETESYMNWAQLRNMQKNGWEVTNHSLVHDCTMQTWTREKIAYELKNSKLILWRNSLSSDIFVTPCGVDSKVMREESSKLFMGYRTVDPGFNDPANFNPYGFKVKNVDDKVTVSQMKSWIDEAKSKNLWVILVFHKIGEGSGISVEDEFNTPKKDFEEIVRYIKDSNIKVVVPGQIMISQK